MEKLTLKKPLKNGKDKITEINIKSPNAGALRGLSLTDLADLKVDAILKVIPRITDPIITEEQAEALSFGDLIAVGGALAKFIGGDMGNDTTPTP